MLFLFTSTSSAEVLDKSEQWQSFLSIYGWLPAINGDLKAKGVEADLDVSYSDILSKLNFAFFAHKDRYPNPNPK